MPRENGPGRRPGPFSQAQRLFEDDGTPYLVSLARGTRIFFNILRKYGTPLPNFWGNLNLRRIDRGPHRRVRGSFLSVLGRFPGLFHGGGLENRPTFFQKYLL